MKTLFPKPDKKMFKKDLKDMLEVIISIGRGEKIKTSIGNMSIKDYAKYMSAPLRMDLMIQQLEKDGKWHCNQKCLNCYASNEIKAKEEELISILKEAIEYVKEFDINIMLTSPGWISECSLKALGLNLPMCGAYLSNMAISPSGDVIPCQSWLDGT